MSTLKDENSTEFTFIEAVKDALLTQHIKEPTRLTGRDKASEKVLELRAPKNNHKRINARLNKTKWYAN